MEFNGVPRISRQLVFEQQKKREKDQDMVDLHLNYNTLTGILASSVLELLKLCTENNIDTNFTMIYQDLILAGRPRTLISMKEIMAVEKKQSLKPLVSKTFYALLQHLMPVRMQGQQMLTKKIRTKQAVRFSIGN